MRFPYSCLLAGAILVPVLCGHSATSVETLVVPGATVVKVLDGFKFTEGPAWDGKRALYFTDIPNERIHKWEDGKLSVFREKSGRANGLYFDKEGALVMCEGLEQ